MCRQRTTRDREISQFSVLRRLGWNIYRVWTPDWWENDERELGRIVEAIGAAMSLKRVNSDAERVNSDAAAVDSNAPADIASGDTAGDSSGKNTAFDVLDRSINCGENGGNMSCDDFDNDSSRNRVNVSTNPAVENTPLASGKFESELNGIQPIPTTVLPDDTLRAGEPQRAIERRG